tara:strand:+ start:2519 stop:3289 length:771 start_codon:yes stop_codon:yes gene_type:complete
MLMKLTGIIPDFVLTKLIIIFIKKQLTPKANMLKISSQILLTLLFLTSCSTIPVDEISIEGDKINYFNELVFGSEFGNSNHKTKKWTEDINIFVAGEVTVDLNSELDLIIVEINSLIENVKLNRVKSPNESNYIIYFGTGEDYAKLEPNAASYVKDNWGLFWVYWNSKNEIYKGSMYVDTIRVKSKAARKHLLREELTQSLGIMNDSYKYPNSIFYQKWSKTTDYSDIDEFIISTLYSKRISAGMTKEKVINILIP